MSIVQALGRWTAGAGPLYLRLAAALRGAIERGDLAAGTRLPPERALAQTLAVSRSTVVAAYDQLRQDGLLESRQGSGTWVPGRPSRPVPLLDAETRRPAEFPAFRALLESPSVSYSLSAACSPAIGFVADVAAKTMRDDLPLLTATTHGYAPLGLPALRAAVASRFTEQGARTDASEVLVTSGSQQAIALLAALLVARSDTVVVEETTYPGAIDVFTQTGARLVTAPMDRDGMRPDELRDIVATTSPRAIYLMPTFHNPTGALMPEHRRREIVRIAREFHVPVIEDLTLADITLDRDPPPPLAAYASGANVFSIGSVSKLFWGGLRVGWVRAPEPVIARLARVKTVADLGTSMLSQAVAARLLPLIPDAVETRRDELLPRLDLLERLLREHLPSWTWTRPHGGTFLWVRLPHGDAAEFARLAVRYGVEIVSGSTMRPDAGASQHIRLPFVFEPSVLTGGVRALAHAWHAYAPVAQEQRESVGVLV